MNFIKATTQDIPTIRAIAHECWPLAYTGIISKEQIAYMLEKMYSETSLMQQMTLDGCEFILAESKETIVGFASFSQVDSARVKLHKLYLLSAEKSKGYGKALMDQVIQRSLDYGAKILELQVNKQNPAIAFYKSQNFIIQKELLIDIGGGFVMDDYVMQLAL